MTCKYTFWNESNHDFLGALFLETDQMAKEIAEKCRANKFVNEHTKTEYKKCSVCGWWENKDNLTNGLCFNCNYKKQIEVFNEFLIAELSQADTTEKMEELYEERFIISFKGKTLTLEFGAAEYNSITNCLEEIISEL